MFTKPTLNLEKQLWRQGYQNIIGLDEAGKGAWAGPIVAAAVVLPKKINTKELGLNDSKKLSPQKREQVFLKIIKNIPAWSVGVISHEYIDREGIIPANRHAMYKAVNRLVVDPHYLLVDGIKFFHHSYSSIRFRQALNKLKRNGKQNPFAGLI